MENTIRRSAYKDYILKEEDYKNIPVDIENDYLDDNRDTLIENENIEETLDSFKKDAIEMHPRIVINNKYEKYSVCTSTGLLGCGKSCGNSDFEDLGIGIVIYFKMLKAWLIVIFLAIILTIPILIIFTQNNTYVKSITFQDMLFKTTIGNIGAKLNSCNTVNVTQSSVLNTLPITNSISSNSTLTLNCQNSTVASIDSFGIAPDQYTYITDQENCIEFSSLALNITLSDKCTMPSYLTTQVQNCASNSANTCSVSISSDLLLSSCQISTGILQIINVQTFFYTYTCLNNNLQILNWSITRATAPYIVVFLDVAIVLLIFIGILVISRASNKSANDYYLKVNQISDYSVHFSNLNFNSANIDQELNKFMLHIDKVINKSDELQRKRTKSTDMLVSNSYFYDINYPFISDENIDAVLKKNELEEKRLSVMRTIAFKPGLSNKEKEKLIKERSKLDKKINSILIKSEENYKITKVDDIWVTFNHMKQAKMLKRKYTKYNQCERFCLRCCCQGDRIDYLLYENEWIKVETDMSLPSDIKWQNMSYSGCRRFMRRITTFIISLVLIVASFGLVVAAKYAQTNYVKQYDTTVSCNYVDISNLNQILSTKLATPNDGYTKAQLNCFCRNKLSQLSYNFISLSDFSVTFNGSVTNPCKDWVTSYLRYNSLTYGIIILIPTINAILLILLKYLTLFERNKTVSEDLISTIIKCFIAQLINTVLVLVLVNAYNQTIKTNHPDFFILTGNFTDMSSDWFKVVGATIAFSMVINIISPHIADLMYWAFKGILRCRDTGCCTKKQSSKFTKKEYLSLYVGPEFDLDQRYAQTLTTIFVVLMFSSGIPILYVFLFCYLFTTYLTDKILIIHFYRKPPQHDIFISNFFSFMLFIGLLIHLSFAIWIYGNPDYFPPSSNTIGFLGSVQSYFQKLFSFLNTGFGTQIQYRITLGYNLLLLILLLLLLIFIILRFFFLNLLSALFSLCVSQELEIGVDETEEVPIQKALGFNKLFDDHQIKKLKIREIFSHEGMNKLKDLYINSLAIDRYYMLDILRQKHYPYSNDVFTELSFIFHVKIHPFTEKCLMVGDSSYNMVYNLDFESCAYSVLISNAGMMKQFKKEKEIRRTQTMKKKAEYVSEIEKIKDENEIIVKNGEIEYIDEQIKDRRVTDNNDNDNYNHNDNDNDKDNTNKDDKENNV